MLEPRTREPHDTTGAGAVSGALFGSTRAVGVGGDVVREVRQDA